MNIFIRCIGLTVIFAMGSLFSANWLVYAKNDYNQPIHFTGSPNSQHANNVLLPNGTWYATKNVGVELAGKDRVFLDKFIIPWKTSNENLIIELPTLKKTHLLQEDNNIVFLDNIRVENKVGSDKLQLLVDENGNVKVEFIK